ncbi:MAG: trypsin-like peptidase domain-containing protein [Betaproteobacteria bacterium]|nr:trypsin-like peptidase domain-containing protein [Betaproteobacteria bacterium]
MRKLWLVFAQTATICLAVLFVVSTLRPDLLAWNARDTVVTVKEPQADAAARAAPSYSDAARKAIPAVVNIYTSQQVKRPRHPFMDDPVFRYFFGEQADPGVQRREGLGSGVIVSDKGYILTNHHVVESVDQIEVALADARKVPARVVGTDPETDLAVLKIELQKLPSITFGRADQVRVGDVVLAIGNPFGVGQTVTFGIVSGLGRSHLGITTFENFIQTDAAINPIARRVMEQIIQQGSVTRGWIGVGVQDVTRELADTFKLPRAGGVLISQVERASPAEKAGVKLGDVLLAVNGQRVTDTTGMLNLIAGLQPGQQARLKLARNQAETELEVTVGRRPKSQRK